MAITNVVANAQLLSAIFSVPLSRYYDDRAVSGGNLSESVQMRVTRWKSGC
jgi:hypothetical protein